MVAYGGVAGVDGLGSVVVGVSFLSLVEGAPWARAAEVRPKSNNTATAVETHVRRVIEASNQTEYGPPGDVRAAFSRAQRGRGTVKYIPFYRAVGISGKFLRIVRSLGIASD